MKTFPELSESELDFYLEANVAAVRAVAESTGGFDAALANHLVMGPAILARADVGPFAAKIHGSALEYTVKPNPRFLPYAYEGMEAAAGVLVGSGHTAESLWAALPDLPGPPREDPALGTAPASTSRSFGRRSDEPGLVGVRRQVDRLQGRRSADRGLAVGAGGSPGGKAARSPATASTRMGCAGCWRLWIVAIWTMRGRWRGWVGGSKGERGSRCRSSRRSSPIRRPGTWRRPGASPARSS